MAPARGPASPAAVSGPVFDEYRRCIDLTDTDAAGVVFISSPTRWSQAGFENLLRSLGMPLEEVIPRDLHYPFVSLKIDHMAPLTLGRPVVVRTGIVRVGSRSVEVLTTVTDETSGATACTIRRVGVAKSRSGAEVEAEQIFRDIVCEEAQLEWQKNGKDGNA